MAKVQFRKGRQAALEIEDGLHIPIVDGGGTVQQVSPDLSLPADLLAAYNNFDGVVAGDFVTITKTSNGQSILALSGSPETIGESTIVLDKPASQPCALEFEASIARNRHQFATAGLFDNLNGVAEPTLTPINITSIYQSSANNGAAYNAVAGTVLTIVLETALPRWPAAGAVYLSDWVHVNGLVDSRLNYPNLAVQFISADRKIITCGFSDEVVLPSLAVPAITPTLGTAKLHFYNNMAGAHDGATMRFTGTTDTSAALLTLFGGGDAQVTGNIIGDHRITIGSTARNLITASNDDLELKATNRYRIECRPRETSFFDRVIDNSAATWNTRASRTAVKPGSSAKLRPRMRLYRPPSMSRPVAKIVSAVKTGTTTATVTTASPHGLVTGNYVTCKGARDITNFPNLTTPVAITVTGLDTFTLVWGGAVTATSYGGVTVLANGGQDITNPISQNVQAAVIDSTTGWLSLTGNATWTGAQAGDFVHLYGVRENLTGADLGLDGAWRVVFTSTTNLTVAPIFDIAGNLVSPAVTTLASTNCGGAVFLRTTIRVHDLMFEAWSENQVMIDGAGTGRIDKAVPVNVLASASLTIGTMPAGGTAVVGVASHDAVISGNPVRIGGRAVTANYAAVASGDVADLITTTVGALVQKPYSIPELDWQYPAPPGGLLNSISVVPIKAAAGAGLRNYVTGIDFWSESLTNATDLRIRESDIACSSQTIASNTLVTAAAHELAIGDAVVFTASTVTGVTAGVAYYVLTTPNTTSITLSANLGGSTLAISGVGVTATFHKVLWQTRIPTTGSVPRSITFETPLRGSMNRTMSMQTSAASGAGAVHLSARGYAAP